MDTSISRIDEFRAPPPYPKLSAVPAPAAPAQGMTPERLDELDALAARMLIGKPYGELYTLPLNEKIYVALAANALGLFSHSKLDLTIPEAIDRLGWADASAMVARWRHRRG